MIGNMKATSNSEVSTEKKQIVISEQCYSSPTKSSLSIEEVEELYGEIIIQRHLNKQEQEKYARRMSNLRKGSSVHKANADIRKAQIIALVLDGYIKQDIERMLGVSRSTIDRALRGLTPELFDSIVERYKNTVFAIMGCCNHDEFCSVDCSYSKFRKLLVDKYNKIQSY